MKDELKAGHGNPLVSILLCLYNAESTIEAALASIIQQTYKYLEIVVIDDGSTDTGPTILKTLQKRDHRIKIYTNEQNLGLTKSLIRGLSYCRGEYIARQDADDQSLPWRIEKQLNCCQKFNLDFLAAQGIDSSGKRSPSNYFALSASLNLFSLGNYFIHGTFFGKKNFFHEIGYREKYKMGQDYDLILNAIKRNKKIGFLDHPVYLLYTGNNRISHRHSKEQYSLAAQMRVEHGFATTLDPILTKLFHLDGMANNILRKILRAFAYLNCLLPSKRSGRSITIIRAQ